MAYNIKTFFLEEYLKKLKEHYLVPLNYGMNFLNLFF